MKFIILTFLVSIFSLMALAQQNPQSAIEVADLTIKIGGLGGEEALWYSFSEGDQIVFSMKEKDGKELKEVDIYEHPDIVKFQDYKTSLIENKVINVTKTGIYKFVFYNSALGGRICKISIKRQPKNSETINFNTSVKWVEKLDTIYNIYTKNVTIGYNTRNVQQTRKVLDKNVIEVKSILSRNERINSKTNMSNTNSQTLTFQLPINSYYPNTINPYQISEVQSWAYSITAGGTGQVWYQDANKKAIARGMVSTTVKLAGSSTPYGALAVLAIEGVSLFSMPPNGENIKFAISSYYNGQSYTIASGNSVVAKDNISNIKQGTFSLRLENDNLVNGINVEVNVIAIVKTQTYKDETYTVQEKEPIKEKQTIKDIKKVEMRKVPTLAD